mgnify:FL=1
MPRFNTRTPTLTRTTNLAGGPAFVESPELELASLVLTSFVKDQFYRSADDSIERLRVLIESLKDKRFAAKVAIYARREFHMRSITHAVAGHLATMVKGEQWTRPFYRDVVERVDDATEILSFYLSTYGEPVPNALKDGLAQAIVKFDAYQLAKYRAEGKSVSLVDLCNLVHPKPTDRNREAFATLMKGELKSTETWEAQLSKAGQDADEENPESDLKAVAWAGLLESGTIGQFALLRNLRNIVQQAPAMVPHAEALLLNEKRIAQSKILPFRYATAIDELVKVGGSGRLATATAHAMELSLKNVPTLPGKTCVVLDCSGSMLGKPAEIGQIFAAVLYKANDADMVLFSDKAAYVQPLVINPTYTIARSLPNAAGGTNLNAVFTTLDKPYDRIVILSDMQSWMSPQVPQAEFEAYCRKFSCRPHIYSFDLQGYGTLQFPEPKVYALAGFSDKVFDLMAILEQDRMALVNAIEAVPIG